MQKKHLHLFLLLLALAGCGPRKFTEVNPYFIKRNKFSITLDEDTPAMLLYGGVELRTYGLSTPSFRLVCSPFVDGPWDLQWGNARQEPLDLPRRTTERSLLSLSLSDTSLGFVERAIPLPDGQGAAFYLESKASESFSFSLTMASDDTLWSHQARRLSERLLEFDGPNGVVLIAGAGDRIVSDSCVTGKDKAPAWEFLLTKKRAPQMVLAFGTKPAEVRARVEKYAGLSAREMEDAVIGGLGKHAGMMLHTSDERANRVIALLACALAGADARLPATRHLQIEENAQAATGLYLASRQRPLIVFPPSDSTFREQAKRDNLRWGSAAFRSALAWGMADDDTLRWLSLDVLAGLERLEAEYITSDAAVVADNVPTDSLMRLCVAHIRLAGLMQLGEDLSFARGDHEAQNNFRRQSIWVSKRAQEYFGKCCEAYRKQVMFPKLRLEANLDTSATDVLPDAEESNASVSFSAPDSALYLSAGARYGFNWLDPRPVSYYNPRLSVGGFVWQKWMTYHIKSDVTISQTPDFDSLTALVLDGPVPGLLTADPGYEGEPSVEVMAAAYQNLAEVYLGLRPDAFQHKIWIEPRVPMSWGHTAARVPYGTGYLHLEYDFGHDFAIVGMQGISTETQIFFGYPIPSGGFLRTQFTLVPGDHPQKINLHRRDDNRLELVVNDAR